LAFDVVSKVKEGNKVEPMLHLPCINYSKSEIDLVLEECKKRGIDNILALRGDINPDIPPKNDFRYASDLVSYIKERGDFDIAGACYPEVHSDSANMVEDILNLKKKVDAGADHLITQLFFDNDAFYNFREKTQIAGIHVPIEAGIMPVTNKSQIERMVTMCGASLPAKFAKVMQKYEHNPEALRDAGIAYAINQIVDLLANGVDGIHLYTMNNAYVAKHIYDAVASLLK
jgi:methylenetetrahydrofolate reductase (NADPH)